MANNKIIYGGQVLIDLTGDTVTADKVAKDITFHDMAGNLVSGTNTFDSDTTDATATMAEVLNTKTFYARGAKITGSMPNRGGVEGTISDSEVAYQIPQGYHDGSGTVSISEAEKAKLTSANIRKGVTILGTTGELETDTERPAPSPTITPTNAQQVIVPGEGYTCFTQFTVGAIPYASELNSAGGYTVTIG